MTSLEESEIRREMDQNVETTDEYIYIKSPLDSETLKDLYLGEYYSIGDNSSGTELHVLVTRADQDTERQKNIMEISIYTEEDGEYKKVEGKPAEILDQYGMNSNYVYRQLTIERHKFTDKTNQAVSSSQEDVMDLL